MHAIARYFSLQAANPLHFGDTIRMDIENKICDEHGPRKDSFVTAQEHAYQLMNEVDSYNMALVAIGLAYLASSLLGPTQHFNVAQSGL